MAPWILVHGWLDNAGTFDTLAPLLVSSHPGHSLLCLDYPGHGHSSHLPPGQMYHYLETIRYIRYVAQHMGYDKFGLMGHSMGAGMSSVFAATYPEMVTHLVMIDLIKPVGRKVENIIEKTRLSIDNWISIDKKMSQENFEKVFKTEEEALVRLQEAAKLMQGEGAVTEESSRIILKRGIKKVDGGYIFSRDLRHRITSLYGLSPDMCQEFAKNIKCPHLLIKADSPNYEDDDIIAKTIEIYSKNPNFLMVNVKGSHHVHLNSPELLMPSLTQFLNT